MKILITSDTYLPTLGGSEIYAYKLGSFLKNHGHQVRLLTLELKNAGDDKSPFPIVRVLWRRRLKDIIHFYRIFIAEFKDADLIHCIEPHKSGAVAAVLKIFYKKPIVVTLEGRGILDLPGNNWFYSKIHTLYRILSLKLSDKIIASCTEFVERASRYVPREKIIYIPNAVDIDEFQLQPKNMTLLPEEFRNKKIITTIRRLVPKNGIQFLIEAAPYIVEKCDQALFFIIGWGRLEDYLKERVRALNLEKYFYFAGAIENSKLPEFLNLADVVVFPSTAEATSIACLESMALGKPIVASKVGGYLDMIKDGVNGHLVNLTNNVESNYDAPMTLDGSKLKILADSVLDILQNEEKSRQFGVNSRKLAEEHFNWRKNILKILDIYDSLSNQNL